MLKKTLSIFFAYDLLSLWPHRQSLASSNWGLCGLIDVDGAFFSPLRKMDQKMKKKIKIGVSGLIAVNSAPFPSYSNNFSRSSCLKFSGVSQNLWRNFEDKILGCVALQVVIGVPKLTGVRPSRQPRIISAHRVKFVKNFSAYSHHVFYQ